MRLGTALAAILPQLGNEIAVAANGFISRVAAAERDRPESFYMLGSMGLAAAIGLGIALARPERRVLVLDGDGNLLMGLGTLALIGAEGPPNLLHLLLDNGVYASTGNQPTAARRLALDRLAAAVGYRWVGRADDREALAARLPEFLAATGPAFLRVRIVPEATGAPAPRVGPEPPAIAARLRGALCGGAGR